MHCEAYTVDEDSAPVALDSLTAAGNRAILSYLCETYFLKFIHPSLLCVIQLLEQNKEPILSSMFIFSLSNSDSFQICCH